MMVRATWLVIVLAACGDDNQHHADARPSIDAVDANLGGFPAVIAVGPSSGTVSEPFRVDASGTAASPLGMISIAANAGAIELSSATITAFVYERQPFSPYTLFQGIAVAPGNLDIFWLYCQGSLVDVYDEGIGAPELFYRAASGTCTDTPTAQTVASVQLPALTIATPAPSGGYTVTGGAITVNIDGTGTLSLGGAPLPLIVFDDVDCSTSCGSPGWYELHSLVWDEADQRVIFVIVYLVTGATTSVELAYARSLPDLTDPIGTLSLPATWTAQPTPNVRAGIRRGVPPPELLDHH